ncbi:MAG: bifunctional diaminohydroxyphosphoribosylaminopyrimidine deaminase/5-amino-6-(5-phosphoribosylamino)uracil reductase RibD [Crocinitomicaceae bacterium]
MNKQEKYMARCIELAKKGQGYVAPNPMVGSVIVYEDRIIGEGYHQEYGTAHAEVNAINSVKDKNLLSKSTLYVSLEPCAHFGKTPPCSDLIIANKIPNVVIGSIDPFSAVNGKGIQKLKDNGIDVTTGVLEKECQVLNKRFFTFHEKKRPYIILKWAQTKDGFIDKTRTDGEIGINWITQPETKSLVHLWRSQEMGVLVGRQTVAIDNPQLNVREIYGKDPVRILLDSQLKLDYQHMANKFSARTIVLNTVETKTVGQIDFIQLKSLDVTEILHSLWENEIQSVIIEGGTFTLEQFLSKDAWDEIRVLEGINIFNDGLKAPTIHRIPQKITNFGKDTIFQFWK